MLTGHSWINTKYLLLHYKCILKCCTAILSCWAEMSNKSGLVESLWNNKNNNREPCSFSLGLEWITCCYTRDQAAEKGKLTTLQEVSSWSPHFLYLCNQFGWNSLQGFLHTVLTVPCPQTNPEVPRADPQLCWLSVWCWTVVTEPSQSLCTLNKNDFDLLSC